MYFINLKLGFSKSQKFKMNPTYNCSDELAMAWINLSYVQNNIFSRQSKPILVSLNGRINFHSLTALMGPSGAGKTTLLKCINMRNNAGLTSHTKLFVNKYIPLRTCFVTRDQNQHLFSGLTVR
jgi:ABC-type multidrug transport system ATPase subunit